MISDVHPSHFFRRALVGDALAYDVRLEVDDRGLIKTLTQGAEPQPDDQVHDIALPGMPNAHSHAHQYALAGRTEQASGNEDNFWSWREAMYRLAGRITPEQLHAITAQLYVDLLKGGYTCVGEFQYIHHDVDGAPYSENALMSQRILDAADQTGIGVTILPVLYRYGDFAQAAAARGQRRFINDVQSYLRIVESLASATRDKPLQRVGLAPHSLRAVSAPMLHDVLTGSPLPDTAPIHIHIAEQTKEVDDAKRVLKRRPVHYLLENFDVNARWCLVHATHMDDTETRALAACGAVVGLCPTTEANLGDGLFQARLYKECGGRIAIGSDSNIATDAAGELRLLEYVQRLRARERNVLATGTTASTGQSLLHAAARGGAQALAQPVGGLVVGARADFVTLDTDHPQLFARDHHLPDAYVFGAGAQAVHDVYVAGRRIIEAGHHPHEEDIAKAYRKAMRETAP